MDYQIRAEVPADHEAVGHMTREAFWNLYVPGCHEHYLVDRIRRHRDFVPELDLVLEGQGQVLASILYTRARLVGPRGKELDILTFGPLCVRKGHQRQGLGKALMAESFARAAALGYPAVVIFGNPGNYVSSGFQSCARHAISLGDAGYPTAMLVRELRPGAIPPGPWQYLQSEVFDLDEAVANAYDEAFPASSKQVLPCQEEFYILSHSRVFPPSP